jgi:hypothetical protein
VKFKSEFQPALLLVHYPKFYPETADGKWHDLRVNLLNVKDGKKIALTYRRGYQSQPQKR